MNIFTIFFILKFMEPPCRWAISTRSESILYFFDTASLYSFVSKFEKRKRSIASLSVNLKLKLKRHNFKITHVEAKYS